MEEDQQANAQRQLALGDWLVTDPGQCRAVAASLAESLANTNPDLVLTWENTPDVVLAHAIAHDLGISVARAVEVEGLVELIDPVDERQRVVLLAVQFPTDASLTALRSLVSAAGATIVGIATCSESSPLNKFSIEHSVYVAIRESPCPEKGSELAPLSPTDEPL